MNKLFLNSEGFGKDELLNCEQELWIKRNNIL